MAETATGRENAALQGQEQGTEGTEMLQGFVRDMLTYLPSKLLPALTGFISAPILTRLFLPAEYGNYALALGVSSFLFALACSGLGSIPIRFFPAYEAESKLGVFFATLGISTGTVIAVTAGVSFFMLFMLRAHLPPALYPLLTISVMIFIVESVFIILMGVVRAQERSGSYTVFTLLSRYSGLGLGLLFVIVFGSGVEGLLWGTLLALALAVPPLLFLTTRGVSIRRQQFRSPNALQMWRYAWPLALGNMAMWGLRLSDRYIISFFRPESEVGLYSVAYGISDKSIDMLVALFLLSMAPLVMNTWESQGREATEKALRMITRLFLIFCLPCAAGLSFLAAPFVSVFTAEAYHEGYRIVGYVAFSTFAWGLFMMASMGTLIKKNTRRIAVNQIVAALVNLALNLLLVPRFGFVAAGITTLIGYAVLFALQAYTSRVHLTWRFPYRTLRNVVIATACMGLAIRGVHSVPGNRGDLHLGYLSLSLVAAVFVYSACLLLLGEVNEEERTAAKRLWHEVAGKAG